MKIRNKKFKNNIFINKKNFKNWYDKIKNNLDTDIAIMYGWKMFFDDAMKYKDIWYPDYIIYKLEYNGPLA